MAAQRVGRRVTRACGPQSPGQNQQRRQARVTVKYNRKELQRRLEVEKWVDCGLDELYRGRVSRSPSTGTTDRTRTRSSAGLTAHLNKRPPLLPGNLCFTTYLDQKNLRALEDI